MEEQIFKYRFGRRMYYLSVLYVAAFALIVVMLHTLYAGGYLSAWFLSLVIALFALFSLSIPRKIVVKPTTVEILCLLDMTEIPRPEIAAVRRVSTRRMRGFIPLFGGCGFFGYYGHYFNLNRFEKVLIYASRWDRFVEITDIYEQKYYVSCDDPDRLVETLRQPVAFPACEDEQP